MQFQFQLALENIILHFHEGQAISCSTVVDKVLQIIISHLYALK